MVRKIMLVIASVVISVLLFGCDSQIYEALSRGIEDPFVEKPLVRSFLKEKSISISWQKDKGADSYILERADDSVAPLLYKEIYRGKEFSYEDKEVEDEKLYMYRLYKQRGEKSGWVSAPALGVGSLICRDEHESNDREEEATWIGPMRISNLYYYKSHDGQVVADEDWYYVKVTAHTIATIVLEDYQAGSALAATHFKIIVKGGGHASQIINNTGIDLINPDNEEKKIYFKIIADESRFVTSPTQTGGAIIQYQIYIFGTARL